MTFMSFEKWKKCFPELTNKWKTCPVCKGEGSRWDEFYELWTFCRRCEGEGSILLDKVLYNKCVRIDKSRMTAWIEGKPFKAGNLFEKVCNGSFGDMDWEELV